jgi:uncharacterized protein involved in exopolysaccharide biosynthesis
MWRRRSAERAEVRENDASRMAPQPEIFEGPVLPDMATSAAVGSTLGAVAGFFVAAVISPIKSVDPGKAAASGAG